MMKDNGGYAFPHDVEERSQDIYGETKTSKFSDPGMTVRDYFAAKAMQSLIMVYDKHAFNPASPGEIANQTGLFADAMIEARKK